MNVISKILRKFAISRKKYKWVFIVGCYNSGTSLLLKILQHHTQITSLPNLGEGQWLTNHLVTPASIGIPRLWVEKEELFRFDPSEKKVVAQKIKKDLLKVVRNYKADFILEKTNANAARMPWSQENFPNSYFIHIIRNGYAVARGIEIKVTPKIENKKNLLQRAAFQWNRSAELVLEDSKKINNFLEISYEDLTDFPKQTTEQICNFLQIELIDDFFWDKTFSVHGLKEKIANQNPERLKQMTTEQKKIIESKANEMLKYYGYKIN